jgi:lycopene cyclase domain-containing protein
LALSFDKKLRFYKQWKFVVPAIFIVGMVYIIFDIYFTKHGVWGFNPQYHSGVMISGLPLEEWLFFIIVPYASIFLHDSFVLYFPKIRLGVITSRFLTISFIVIFSITLFFTAHKMYTFYILCTVIVSLLLSLADKTGIINRFYVTFILILIPFLLVNSILTGSFIDEEVVWYTNSENLGIRFFTIPIEDFGYAFSLIFLGLLLRNAFKFLFLGKTAG